MATPGPTTQADVASMAANILQIARLRRGWTQRQLARAAGVPVSTVGPSRPVPASRRSSR